MSSCERDGEWLGVASAGLVTLAWGPVTRLGSNKQQQPQHQQQSTPTRGCVTRDKCDICDVRQ